MCPRPPQAKRPRTAAQVVVIDDDDEDGEEGEGGEESDAAEDPALDVFADALSMQLERLVSRDDPPVRRGGWRFCGGDVVAGGLEV